MCYKPDNRLNKIIKRLYAQKVRPDRILIMLTVCEEFGRRELANLLGPLKYIVDIEEVAKEDYGHGKTRQLVAERSDADYILFLTQDATPVNRDLTKTMLARFACCRRAAVVYARQKPYKSATTVERYSRGFNYPASDRTQTEKDLKTIGIKAIFSSDSCAMYKRSVLMKLGGFDVTAQFNEDMLYAYKAVINSYSVEYCASSIVFHSHSFNLKEQFDRNREMGKNQRSHPEIFGSIRSESEGVRYVLNGIRYFASKGDVFSIGELILTSAVRYAGYFAGRYLPG